MCADTMRVYPPSAGFFRDIWSDKAGEIKHVEAFEICEYGAQPYDEEIRRLFPMLGK